MRSDYRAQSETSLSLGEGETFHIMQMQVRNRQDCYIVRNKEGLEGVVPKQELGDVELPSWFQAVDRRASENQLSDAAPGRFLIRNTQHGREGEYSVSVRYPDDVEGRTVRHFKLVRDPNSPSTWMMWGERFNSLQQFVAFFQDTPIDRGNSQVTLDREAEVEVLQAGEVGYAGYEEDNHPYEVDNSDDDEPGDGGDIVEGSQVVCTEMFEAEEEGTLTARPGDKLLVLFPPNQGWVYVKNTRRREGYLPLDCVTLS